jgi:hypothetical protein
VARRVAPSAPFCSWSSRSMKPCSRSTASNLASITLPSRSSRIRLKRMVGQTARRLPNSIASPAVLVPRSSICLVAINPGRSGLPRTDMV